MIKYMKYRDARLKYFEKLICLEHAIKLFYWQIGLINLKIDSFISFSYKELELEKPQGTYTPLKNQGTKKDGDEKILIFYEKFNKLIEHKSVIDSNIYDGLDLNYVGEKLKKIKTHDGRKVYKSMTDEEGENNKSKNPHLQRTFKVLRNYYERLITIDQSKPLYSVMEKEIEALIKMRNCLAHQLDSYFYKDLEPVDEKQFENLEFYISIFLYRFYHPKFGKDSSKAIEYQDKIDENTELLCLTIGELKYETSPLSYVPEPNMKII